MKRFLVNKKQTIEFSSVDPAACVSHESYDGFCSAGIL